MSDVLISYARRDRGVAGRLAAALADRGLKAVWDIADLPEGALFHAAISRVRAAPAVIVLWSRDSSESAWVAEEALEAVKRNALVSASIDGTPSPISTARASIDIMAWVVQGEDAGLDALIKAVAETATLSQAAPSAPPPEREPSEPLTATGAINLETPPASPAMPLLFIIIAFLTLLGVAVAKNKARTPTNLPPVSMDAKEPLDVTIIPPTPEEENAPSGLRPIPETGPKPLQDSTGSVKK